MTEIAVRNENTLAEMMEWSKAMSTGDMLPRQYRGNPANLMFACEYADALGIPRINALTSIHVIDGRPTASADLIASLVRKAGHKLRVEGDDTYAEATIIRADDPDYVPKPVRWDEAKARKAGKWASKGPWTNYPAAMLRSRAITEAARMWASDALYGVIYTAEELGGTIDEDGSPAPAPRQQSRPRSISEALGEPAESEEATVVVDVDSLMSAIEKCSTIKELESCYEQSLGLPQHNRSVVWARIKELKADILALEEAGQVPEPEQLPLDAEPVDAETVEEQVGS